MCTCQLERGVEEESQRKEKEPTITVLGGEAAMGEQRLGNWKGMVGKGGVGKGS